MGDSYLHQALGADKPLFQFWNSSTGTFNDDTIFSISITRGEDTAAAGISVNTAEVETLGEQNNVIGARSRINLTEYGAKIVSDAAGNVTIEQIQQRFWGRTGIVTVNDVSSDYKTTITSSSSWLSVLKKSNYDPFISVGMKTGLAIINSLKFSNLTGMYEPVPYGTFDSIIQVPEKRSFAELVKLYAEPMGLQVRETTSNTEVQVRTIQVRKDDVIRRSQTAPHITRSAAITPAKHSHTIDSWNNVKTFKTINAAGNEETLSFKPAVDKTFLDISEEDFTYVRRDTNQIAQWVDALESQSTTVNTRPESIKIDLLLLLTSPSEHHRNQAGYLLALQPGDPVFFSFDWQSYIRGVYFAQQIKETVTADTWELELALYPAEHIIGESLDSYNVKPQTWEAAGELKWNSPEITSTRWNEI